MATLGIIQRYVKNRFLRKPLYVAVEVTHACAADCDFCPYRRSNKEKKEGTLDSYAPILKMLQPVFVSFVGGEPLLRKDLEMLVREAKYMVCVPFVSVTTNGEALTPERYVGLSNAGMDMINISLDFPDKRHDAIRGVNGLYDHIIRFLSKVQKTNGAKIGLNTIVMQENIADLREIVKRADGYGVTVTLLPYNALANGNGSHIVSEFPHGLLRSLKMEFPRVITVPDFILDRVEHFLSSGSVGVCDAGQSFLWIRPNGRLRACMDYANSEGITLEEVRQFKKVNTCNRCYRSCRALSESLVSSPVEVYVVAKELYGVHSTRSLSRPG